MADAIGQDYYVHQVRVAVLPSGAREAAPCVPSADVHVLWLCYACQSSSSTANARERKRWGSCASTDKNDILNTLDNLDYRLKLRAVRISSLTSRSWRSSSAQPCSTHRAQARPGQGGDRQRRTVPSTHPRTPSCCPHLEAAPDLRRHADCTSPLALPFGWIKGASISSTQLITMWLMFELNPCPSFARRHYGCLRYLLACSGQVDVVPLVNCTDTTRQHIAQLQPVSNVRNFAVSDSRNVSFPPHPSRLVQRALLGQGQPPPQRQPPQLRSAQPRPACS